MTDIQQLLAEYATTGSEAAFRELVVRYVNFVYSVALRLVDGNTQLAEDVTQTVFIALASKGRTLPQAVMLGGWLHQHTYHAATKAARAERRRQSREREAVEMNTLQDDSDANWRHVTPILDEAITQLGSEDRAAILLRFFEQHDFRSVGEALGTTEDAARMRVTRALEKLHSLLSRHGVTTSAAALGVALTASAVEAAPAGLAATISTAVLAGTTAATMTTATLTRAIAMTTLQKIVITATIAVTAGAGIYEAHRAATLRSQVQTLQQQRAPLTEQVQQLPHEPDIAAQQPAPPVQASPATNSPVAKSPYEQLQEFIASRLTPSREEMQASVNQNRPPKGPTALPREDIEAYVQQNKRNAESLLAAYRISHDPSYLREAATNFPNTPSVQLAVIADQVFPNDQRQWIDAFKASSPDNALAWYFSALDYFNSKQPDLAIQELAQATHRQSFDTYAGQASQAVEEMCNSAGWPPLAAKAWAPSSESVSYLNSLKSLGNQMLQIQQQDLAKGDAASGNSLASMGMTLGNTLRAGGPIEQLVGIANERKILGQLNPSVTYDFLGRPVSDALAELDQQKQAIRVALTARDQILPTLSETDLTSYFERKKLYGEMNAVQWLQSKHPQP